MAKVINCWRTGANHTKLASAWTTEFGSERSKVCCKSLPQRPLRGRWSSKHATETFLLQCGRHELPIVFEKALLSHGDRPKRHRVRADGDMDLG
eukprot:6910947-Lingulodinium_polyedra.AAC.1